MLPNKVKVGKEDGSLTLEYPDGACFTMSGEYLRVHSPSAEVKGHGPGQEVLQHGKQGIRVTGAAASGNYALTLTFSDGHNSGIYSWGYLRDLAENHDQYWQHYLDRLTQSGKFRDANTQPVKLMDPGNQKTRPQRT